jgi:hypothetical protein
VSDAPPWTTAIIAAFVERAMGADVATVVIGGKIDGLTSNCLVGEAKFADRGGDLRDLLLAVRARVSGARDQRSRPRWLPCG